MQIKRIVVSNFRALSQLAINFDEITTLIGENNSGKSAVLAAIALFFSSSPRVDRKDFSNDNISDPIIITITFVRLTPSELNQFSANIIEDELTVTRSFFADNPKESGAFSVDALVNPEFIQIRSVSGKTEKRDMYKALQSQFPDLDPISNADQIDEKLEAWEEANPSKLQRHKVGSFRGFKNVAIGQLRSKCEFILVQAVRDASDDVADARRSPVLDLLNTIAKQTIENNIDFQKFRSEINKRIGDFIDPAKVPALSGISSDLTGLLEKYYADSSLIATWQPISEVPVTFPTAEIAVRNGSFVSDISRVGHGLQRAIILTLLEYVARRRSSSEENESGFEEPQSDIILAIEEPEIYQHPTKQRLFRKVLKDLSTSFSKQTGIRLQIICVTHSPLFVDIARCNEIRLIRKRTLPHPQISVTSVTLEACSRVLGTYAGKPEKDHFSSTQMAARLHVFTPEIAEGFFAKTVVLVEGVSDKSIMEATFANLGRSCLAEGIVVASAGGKNNIDKLAIIYRELQIPTYIVIDNDKSESGGGADGRIACNKILQQLAGVALNDCADWPDGIFSYHCAWDGNIETYIRSIVGGEFYNKVRQECAAEYGISASDCEKSPTVATEMLKRLRAEGHTFGKLDAVIAAIDAL